VGVGLDVVEAQGEPAGVLVTPGPEGAPDVVAGRGAEGGRPKGGGEGDA